MRRLGAHLDYHSAPNLWLVTMSVRNSPEMMSAFHSFNWTWARFFAGAARGKKWARGWDPVDQWIGANEITDGANGVNLHRHLIVATSGEWWDWSALDAGWKHAADDPAAHIDIAGSRRIEARAAVAYVAKYLCKRGRYWGGLTQIQSYRYAAALRGRNRLCRSRGSKPPDLPSGWHRCCFTEQGACQLL